jgi:hypothetical protein
LALLFGGDLGKFLVMELFISLEVIHFILAAAAIVFILRSKIYTGRQKAVQVLFALLVPLVGPFATLLVHWGDRQKTKVSSTKFGESIDDHFRKHVGAFYINPRE